LGGTHTPGGGERAYVSLRGVGQSPPRAGGEKKRDGWMDEKNLRAHRMMEDTAHPPLSGHAIYSAAAAGLLVPVEDLAGRVRA